MDLGALELQIFVSLVVVLGSAFVALVCDYLKGNNEQLRERNIELRVRTEEQERFAILNPSAWLSQFRGTFGGGAARSEQAAPVAAEAVMKSHAPEEGLAYVAQREAVLAQRTADDGYGGESGVASVPEVAGFDVAERRRSRRKRGHGDEARATAPGANSYDWIRPEVMARVARRAGSSARYEPDEAVESTESIPMAASEAVASQSVPEISVSEPMAASFLQLSAPVPPLLLQTEIERVSRTDSRSTASAPPVIMLRPLPSLRLNEELQRISEAAVSDNRDSASRLLEDVIAASDSKSNPVAVEPMAEFVALQTEPVQEIVAGTERADAYLAEAQRAESYLADAQRAESQRVEAEHAEAEHTEGQRAEVYLTEAEGAELQWAAAQRAEVEHADAQRAEAYLAEAERAELQSAAAQRAEVEHADAQRAEAYLAELQRAESERAEAEHAEAQRAEAYFAEVRRAEAERAEAEQAEARSVEAYLAELQRAEAESAETQWAAADRVEVAPEMAMAPIADASEPVQESIYMPEAEAIPSAPWDASAAEVEELPFPSFAFEPSPVASEFVRESPAFVETAYPEFAAASAPLEFPTYDALPPVVETPAYDWAHAEYAPLPETVFASEAFAAQSFVEETFAEVTAFRPVVPVAVHPEVEPEPVLPSIADLLLPTGMQDLATYRRLLAMPNPMSGIVITIGINDYARLASTVSAQELPGLLGSVETLMGSMVREGDFGVKVSDEQWVFVYRIDSQGFSQRRVAGLSEKLWDFQLRHLGLSNLSFSWAAVNVNSERLDVAVTAAIERMESSRRGSKKPGAERARFVVNG